MNQKNSYEINVLELLINMCKTMEVDMFESYAHVTKETGKYPVYTIRIHFTDEDDDNGIEDNEVGEEYTEGGENNNE